MTVYKSKDILCRSEGNLPRFFPKPLQGFSSSHGGFGGLGFQQETCLVGQSLGGAEGWTEASRFELAGCAGWFGEISAVWWFSWMVHLKKLRELLWCFVQSVKYLLARGTSGLPFGKKCNQKTVYCCDGHCALGAHQPLGDGHTSARSGERV